MIIWIQDVYSQYSSKWESPTSNWVELPCTTRETEEIVTSYVNDARNEYGAVIGQIVGRANIKMDKLEWKMINNETASMIMNLTKPKRTNPDVNERTFKFNMRVPNLFDYDSSTGKFRYIELTAYSGDAHYNPYWLDDAHTNYKVGNLKVNLIDCGLASFIGDPTNANS